MNFYKSGIPFFAAAVLAISCGADKSKEATPAAAPRPTPSVEAYLVQSRTLSETIDVPGSIIAEESTEIHPEVMGRVTNLYITEGAQVAKGTVLAKLYDGDLQAQKRKLEVQLQLAKQNEDRYRELQKIGGISKQDYEATQLNSSNTRADLDIVNTEIAKTVIRAPFSGKLGLRAISLGAYVTTATVITTIQKTNGLRLDFNVPEKYTGRIKQGQYVNFTTEGSSRKYTAQVSATESGIAEDTRTLTVRSLVRGDETGLVPGGFAKVLISFAPDNDAVMVPTQAVIPQVRGKRIYVYHGGVANFVEVTTGIRDSIMVQITSGINKGDTVITTGLLGLKPDMKVKLNKVNSATDVQAQESNE